MTSVTAPLRRIAVHTGGMQVDLVIPANDALGHALAVAGVSLQPGDRVHGPGGLPVDPATAASDLREGGLYAVTRGSAASAKDPLASRSPSGSAAISWSVLAASGTAAVIAFSVDASLWRWITAAIVGLVGLLVALSCGARSTAKSPASELLPSLVLGAIAGVLCAPRGTPGLNAALWDEMFAFALGFGGAALAAVVIAATSRAAAARAGATAAAVVLVSAGVFAAVCPIIEWGPREFFIVTAAAAVLAIRALPSLLVNADDGYYIDYSTHMSLRWTVRGRVPKYIERIDAARVRDLVVTAEFRLRVATLVLSMLTAPGIALSVLAIIEDSLVGRIGASVFVCASVAGLLLISRRTVELALRRPPRVAALVGVLGAVLMLVVAVSVPALASLVVAGVLCLVAAIVAAGSVPMARSTRSLGWSRTGDIVEAIAVVVVLPAGLLAAGAIDVLRGVMN